MESIINDTKLSVRDRVEAILRPGILPEPERTRAIEAFVGRAVRESCLGCEDIETDRWAREWLAGTDRTKESAQRTAERVRRVWALCAQGFGATAASFAAEDGESAAFAAACTVICVYSCFGYVYEYAWVRVWRDILAQISTVRNLS